MNNPNINQNFNSTCIIYLIGLPGTGKYSIAKKLAQKGFIICDNQLINNPIFELLNFDGYGHIPDYAWESIEKIREQIFEFLIINHDSNYILTNCLYENDGDRSLYSQVEDMAEKRNSKLIPIKLIIDPQENIKRIVTPSRRKRWKSIDPKDAYPKQALIKIDHPNLLQLDVTNLSATKAAAKIFEHIKKIEINFNPPL